jgi:hypothetical protein
MNCQLPESAKSFAILKPSGIHKGAITGKQQEIRLPVTFGAAQV